MTTEIALVANHYAVGMEGASRCEYFKTLHNRPFAVFKKEVLSRHKFYWSPVMDSNFYVKINDDLEMRVVQLEIISRLSDRVFYRIDFTQ